MRANIVAFVYITVIGLIAFRLAAGAFTQHSVVDTRKVALFLIVNATGFILSPIIPLPTLLFYSVATLAILVLKPGAPVATIALFLFLMPLMPILSTELFLGSLPLIELTWPRLLIILLLIPLAPKALASAPLLHYRTDKYIWLFFALSAALGFRDTTITNGLRITVGLTIDLLIPYLVVSRVLRGPDDIRTVLGPLVAALAFGGLINIFETARHWNVYVQLITNVTGMGFATADRAGLLRAFGPLDRPSQSAFALATGIGMLWALSPFAAGKIRLLVLLGALGLGLILTFSRGSWVAAAFIATGYLATTNFKTFVKVVAGSVVVALPLMLLPITQEIIRILPFVGEQGTQAADTVAYRQELFDAAVYVANQSPFFGSTTYEQHPVLDRLRLADGLLDLVNHYVILLLSVGYVGLGCFLAIFASTFSSLLRALSTRGLDHPATRTVTKALAFTIMGLMLAIATTSAGGKAGIILWCLVAMSAVVSTPSIPKRARAHLT